jgi:proteasome lid subunit RPN8/RPN11
MYVADRPRSIEINHRDWEQMRLDVAHRAPEEACGLLAGKRLGDRSRASRLFVTTNMLHSPTRYRIDPVEQLAAFNQMDAKGLELVGIYHSHPDGPEAPSPTDLAEAYYPEAVYLIWHKQSGAWACNAYAILEARIYPVDIQLIKEPDCATI